MSTTEAFILENRHRPVAELALSLRGRKDVDAAFALRQIEGWQRLRAKVPSWAAAEGLRYPGRLALEQCSGEAAARYKREVAMRLLPGGGSMADLTGGLGVDFSFLAPLFCEATYVERQEELCRLARHNFPLLGLPQARVAQADGRDYLQAMQPADLLLLDPARRDPAGRKAVMLEDCEPDVAALLPQLLEKARYVMLKLSPMLDWHQAVRRLAAVREVHAVASGGECKDLLLVLGCEEAPLRIHCAEDGARFSFLPAEEEAARPAMAATVGAYLYEPGAALLKAGAFKLAATRFGLEKLHPSSHLYTSGRRVEDFPGRSFRVERVVGFGKRELRDFRAATGRANLTVRNFPATVAELRKRLRLKEGGDCYCFATTLADGAHALICCRKDIP